MRIKRLPSANGMKVYSVGDIRVERLCKYDAQCWEHVLLGEGPYKPACHRDSEEVIYVIEGCGSVTIDGEDREYFPGHEFRLPPGTFHWFSPSTRTLLFSVQTPPIVDLDTGEADIHYK